MSVPVELVDYDPTWPAAFEAERDRLFELFTGIEIHVEHVGSTAVPGLGGKPIIDILIGVADIVKVEARIETLEQHAYQYVPEYEKSFPERRFFRRPRIDPRTHHLHCVVTGCSFWRRQLAFRDYLRSDPGTATAYFELKRELASRYKWDRDAYTEGKTGFVESVLSLTGLASA
jgi:GrpB-like predicted nucleotidyltransferase (UPF0157 family)